MNSNDERKPESQGKEDEALMKALEIELAQKRAGWKKAQSRRSSRRSAAFLFLFVVIMGALFALYYVMTIMPRKSSEPPASAPSASPG